MFSPAGFPARRWPVALVVLAVLAAARIAGGDPGRSDALSPRLTQFAYAERGPTLHFSVDTRAARFTDQGTLLPIGIGLANEQHTPLTFGRESFVLEAADGTQYGTVSVNEFVRGYDRSRADVRLFLDFVGGWEAVNVNNRFVSWPAYPVSGVNVPTQGSVSLGRRYWTHALLYFEVPEGGLAGQPLRLLARAREHEEPFVVAFMIGKPDGGP